MPSRVLPKFTRVPSLASTGKAERRAFGIFGNIHKKPDPARSYVYPQARLRDNQHHSQPVTPPREKESSSIGVSSSCARSSLPTWPRAMTIYRSPIPDVTIPNESLFTFLFEGKVDREIPGTTPAFIDAPTGRSITRSEFKATCLSLGWGLRNIFAKKLGGVEVTRGDTVMIFSPNSFAWPFALFGSIAAGFKVTLANSSYTPAELGYQWKDSRAKVVFAHPALVPAVLTMFGASGVSKEEARKRIIVMGVGDKDATANGFVHMDDLLGMGRLSVAEQFDGPLSNETVYLCYSSGTTGKPKGVEVRLFVSSSDVMLYPDIHHSQRIRTSFQTAS